MSSRRRGAQFKPKAQPRKPNGKHTVQHTDFDVRIVGGINEISSTNTSLNALITNLKKCHFSVDVGEAETTSVSREQTKQYVKCKLKLRDVSTKSSAFEAIRKTWFSNICQPGYPFWLESCEEVRNSYRFKANTPQHSFEPLSCSVGSFSDRGTFVEHYITTNDIQLIVGQTIYAEFQHDTKVLEVYFYHVLTKEEYRLVFEYKQFEDYVLVDEKVRGIVDIYVPLLRPPKVVKVGKYNRIQLYLIFILFFYLEVTIKQQAVNK